MTKLITHHGGWIPQKKDERDYKYVPKGPLTVRPAMPGKFSLRNDPSNGPILNQGRVGTCVPNSNADQYLSILLKEFGAGSYKTFLPSRLYIYDLGRQLEGSPLSQDTGMEPRDALKVLAQGVPPESEQPYSDANPGPFQDAPPEAAVAAAKNSHAVNYYSIDPSAPGAPLRSCLLEGYSFTFGFSVPALLESDQMASGQDVLLPLPDNGANKLLQEGHGVRCIGYDFELIRFPVPVFEIKQTWGLPWGDAGHFFLDYRFFSGGESALATDVWTIRTAT